jgi:predicted nucleic acid-binding protein
MAALSGFFFDTSVILAGIIELDHEQPAPQRIMDAIASGRFDGPMTAWHCCLEFFSVATRLPHELRLTPADALRLVQQEVMARFVVHALPRNRRDAFFIAAAHDLISGGRIYDAHIGEVARHAGADVLVTDNRRHYTQLLRHGVRVLTSAELVDEAL